MLPLPFLGAGALLATLVVGLVAHELSHAFALRLAGVPCRVTVLPARDGPHRYSVAGRRPLARVTPVESAEDLSPWQLRAAAMMPLCLLAPVGLVFVGVVPDPFATGNLPLQLATVAWLGCAIPSPGDFSQLWHPHRALATHRVQKPAEDDGRRQRAPGR